VDSNDGRKRMAPAMKLTIVFLCAAAILTFYSRTMYNAGIPTVHVAPVKSESLRIVYKGEGVVVPGETTALYAPGDLLVTEALVRQYDEVEEGGLLGIEYRVSRTEVEVEVRNEGWAGVKGDIGKGDEVVVSSDRPLSDERVKVYQGE